MHSDWDFDRFFINWKTASVLGVAAALSVAGTILIHFDLFGILSLSIAWFIVLLLGLYAGIGSVLYYLAVYLPCVKRRLRVIRREITQIPGSE